MDFQCRDEVRASVAVSKSCGPSLYDDQERLLYNPSSSNSSPIQRRGCLENTSRLTPITRSLHLLSLHNVLLLADE